MAFSEGRRTNDEGETGSAFTTSMRLPPPDSMNSPPNSPSMAF